MTVARDLQIEPGKRSKQRRIALTGRGQGHELVLQQMPRHTAIHRPGVEVGITQSLRQQASNRALACSRRPVDRDHVADKVGIGFWVGIWAHEAGAAPWGRVFYAARNNSRAKAARPRLDREV